MVVATVLLLLCTSITVNSYAQTQKISGNMQSTDISIDPKITDIIESINESLIKRYLETIVGYGPRPTGTYGCEKTARYIYDQFKSMGLATRYQNWTKFIIKHKIINPKPRMLYGQNVEATIPGLDTDNKNIIIFNAHYDSIAASVGADDDASGTVAVLAAAYALSKYQFNYTIKFVAFSGEEQGLYGSLSYLNEVDENGDDILVEFNADMVGYAKTKENGKKFRMYGTKDVKWIMDDIEKVNNETLHFNLTTGIHSEGSLTGSDFASFVYHGYEAVTFWEGDWDPNMHTPEDNLENVNISYLVNTSRFIAVALAHTANIDVTYPHIRIESPQRGKLYLEGRGGHQLRKPNTILINNMWIWADVKPGDAAIEKVEFYYDDALQFTDTEASYKWLLDKRSISKHQIKVVVYDKKGRTSDDWMDIFSINLEAKRQK
jgi:hypothetical protein